MVLQNLEEMCKFELEKGCRFLFLFFVIAVTQYWDTEQKSAGFLFLFFCCCVVILTLSFTLNCDANYIILPYHYVFKKFLQKVYA